jgi:hypothetical protein
MLRLVQVKHRVLGRRVGVIQGKQCRLLTRFRSSYALVQWALASGTSLESLVSAYVSAEGLNYDAIYNGQSDWQLLPAFDHPDEPARCLVSGTGLTHMASAKNRNAMHEKDASMPMTDSMKMFQWGLDGGNPKAGQIGVQPEWFYKGSGSILRAHGDALDVPSFADDGGEEPELAGVYVNDGDGQPCRVGFVVGNEFADHVMEKKNYLYLAPSKLRDAAIGPELIVGGKFERVSGTVSIERKGKVVWSREIKTGEKNMSHSLANLEHHHFKYAAHRRAGDVHIHFYGADAFSFGEGVALKNGDVMVVEWKGFGRPLRNPIRIDQSKDRFVGVKVL